MKAYQKLHKCAVKNEEYSGYNTVKITDAYIAIEIASYEIAVSIIDDVIFNIRHTKKNLDAQDRSYLNKLRKKQQLYIKNLHKIL